MMNLRFMGITKTLSRKTSGVGVKATRKALDGHARCKAWWKGITITSLRGQITSVSTTFVPHAYFTCTISFLTVWTRILHVGGRHLAGVKPLLGIPTFQSILCRSQVQLRFQFQFLGSVHLGSSRWWLRCLGHWWERPRVGFHSWLMHGPACLQWTVGE